MSFSPQVPPKYQLSAFNCPQCGAYSKQLWSFAYGASFLLSRSQSLSIHDGNCIAGVEFARCTHCENGSLWFNSKMIYPTTGLAPIPNYDIPDEIKADYEEARSIVALSPRGAVALLRLVVQKLCKHLGESGDNINEDIKNLVKKGLPEKLQRALDAVRVVGNNAVHPGQIDLKDDPETAIKLFTFINIIADSMITQPKQIDEFYDMKIPESSKEAIDRRDNI